MESPGFFSVFLDIIKPVFKLTLVIILILESLLVERILRDIQPHFYLLNKGVELFPSNIDQKLVLFILVFLLPFEQRTEFCCCFHSSGFLMLLVNALGFWLLQVLSSEHV